MYEATTCTDCVAMGYWALGNGAVTGTQNVAVGKETGMAVTSGYRNTLLGAYAGNAISTGYQNTCVGNIAAYNGLGTGYNNTVIGYNAQPTANDSNNQITLGDANIDNLRCADTSIRS